MRLSPGGGWLGRVRRRATASTPGRAYRSRERTVLGRRPRPGDKWQADLSDSAQGEAPVEEMPVPDASSEGDLTRNEQEAAGQDDDLLVGASSSGSTG